MGQGHFWGLQLLGTHLSFSTQPCSKQGLPSQVRYHAGIDLDAFYLGSSPLCILLLGWFCTPPGFLSCAFPTQAFRISSSTLAELLTSVGIYRHRLDHPMGLQPKELGCPWDMFTFGAYTTSALLCKNWQGSCVGYFRNNRYLTSNP
jgi:hypothetical protein